MRICVKSKEECSSAATLGTIPTGGSKSTTEAAVADAVKEVNLYAGYYEIYVTNKEIGRPFTFLETVPLEEGIVEYIKEEYPSATIIWDRDIKDAVMSEIYPWVDDVEGSGIQFESYKKSEGKDALDRSSSIKDLFDRLEKQGIFENDGVSYEVVEIPYSCQLVIHRDDIETAYIEDSGSQGDEYKITVYDEYDEELDDKYCRYADEAVEYILDWLGGDLNP